MCTNLALFCCMHIVTHDHTDSRARLRPLLGFVIAFIVACGGRTEVHLRDARTEYTGHGAPDAGSSYYYQNPDVGPRHNRVDAGSSQPPPPPLPGGRCDTSGACLTGFVCCPNELPCAGACIPDCRIPATPCPKQVPLCDEATGLCAPDGAGGGPGGGAPGECDDDSMCPEDAICCPEGEFCAGHCIPDCRTAGCPQDLPNCDSSDGMCRR